MTSKSNIGRQQEEGGQCKTGHDLTGRNIKRRRRVNGREYIECQVCADMANEKLTHPASRGNLAVLQRSLRTSTVVREPMEECWNCLPSLATGIRGHVVRDEDGDPQCRDCGRFQKVEVMLA